MRNHACACLLCYAVPLTASPPPARSPSPCASALAPRRHLEDKDSSEAKRAAIPCGIQGCGCEDPSLACSPETAEAAAPMWDSLRHVQGSVGDTTEEEEEEFKPAAPSKASPPKFKPKCTHRRRGALLPCRICFPYREVPEEAVAAAPEEHCACAFRTAISPCAFCLDMEIYNPKTCIGGVFVGEYKYDLRRVVFSTLETAWENEGDLESLTWHKVDANSSRRVTIVPDSELARRRAVPKDTPCARCTLEKTSGSLYGNTPKHSYEGACKQYIATWEF